MCCKRPIGFGLVVWALCHSAVLAQTVNVTVDFSGAPSLTQADQDAILARMREKYEGLDVNISTDAGGSVTIRFTDTDGTEKWGEAMKRGKTATVHVKRASLGATRQAAFDENDFTVVDGQPVGTDPWEPDDHRVAFNVHVTDALLSTGFINDRNEYVEMVPPGGQGVMEFSGGEFANFAVAFQD